MNRERRFLRLLAVMLVAAAPVRGQDIDDFVRGWIEKQHVPAAAIAVVKDGAVIKAEGYGLADVENRISARPDTVFKIGSLSKQFIATGIMLLVQDGKIAVDDKVSKHLEGTPKTWEAITLRHLLTHTPQASCVRHRDSISTSSSPTSMSSRQPIPLRSRPRLATSMSTPTSATSCWQKSSTESAENRGVISPANEYSRRSE
jgi:Beta-lactamase